MSAGVVASPASAATYTTTWDGVTYTLDSSQDPLGWTVVSVDAALSRVKIPATMAGGPTGSANVTTIAADAFSGASATDVVVGPNVTSVGARALAADAGLQSITFEGDAPTFTAGGSDDSFGDGATIYYFGSMSGFDGAKWSAYSTSPISIEFMPNGGAEDPVDIAVPSASVWHPPAPVFTRSGYSFAFWSTTPDGSGTDYGDGTGAYLKPVTLYAQWVPAEYGGGDPFFYEDQEGVSTITSRINWGAASIDRSWPEWDLVIPGSFIAGSDVKSVQAVAANAFMGAPLASIRIPDSVTTIGQFAFNGAGLIHVVIPDSVRTIEYAAFEGDRISTLDLGDGVKEIESYAFGGNPLTSVVIPASVASIGTEAFSGDPLIWVEFKGDAPAQFNPLEPNGSLGHATTLVVEYESDASGFQSPLWNGYPAYPIGSVPELPRIAVSGNALYQYDVSGSGAALVAYLGAPGGSAAIPSSVLLDGVLRQVTAIGDLAFQDAELAGVTLPEDIITIGCGAFLGNDLSQIVLPVGLKTISCSAFEGNRLTDVSIPDSVTALGGQAFLQNALQSVSIGSGIREIGDYAFSQNPLATVTIPSTVVAIGQGAFAGDPLVGSLVIPASVTSIGGAAFQNADFYSIEFQGNAPTVAISGVPDDLPFGTKSGGVQIWYHWGAIGFTVPTWHGYLAQALSTPTVGAPGTIYRFWSPKLGDHFYTADVAERDYIIAHYPASTWSYEGAGFKAFLTQAPGTIPVYRFWSDKNQAHFLTADPAERDAIIAKYPVNVWHYEGIAFYAYPASYTGSDATPLYRFWSDDRQHHFFTDSAAERDSIIASYPTHTWRFEGYTFQVPVG